MALGAGVAWGQAPATAPAGKLPHLDVDVAHKRVRVECEALNVEMPLEFFCCVTGTNEHESVLRSAVKPSHLHMAMLMIGLKPGEPVHYSPSTKKWFPPSGPPVQISVEYERDGKTVSYPGYRLLRDVKTKKEARPFAWVFTGSRVMEDGKYAADVTGYLVSVVNFDLTVIDVPQLASNANETLEWEYNAELVPKTGTKVWMVIEPAGEKGEATERRGDAATKVGEAGVPAYADRAETTKEVVGPTAGTRMSDVAIDEAKVKALRERWEKVVAPHAGALREAAQAHYEVINALRREQQRLIDEADRIQRTIDQLEKEYSNMTTPRPEGAGKSEN